MRRTYNIILLICIITLTTAFLISLLSYEHTKSLTAEQEAQLALHGQNEKGHQLCPSKGYLFSSINKFTLCLSYLPTAKIPTPETSQ